MRNYFLISILILSVAALAGCDVRVKESAAPEKVEKKETTVVNPAPEKKVETNTTIVNPPAEKK